MKKKQRAIVVCVMTIMLMLCQTLTAYAAQNLSFDITSLGKADPKEKVSFAVNANVAGITDGKATISYDANKLTYESAKLAYTSEEGALEFVVNSNEDGKLVIVWATLDPMKEPGCVFTVDFTVKEDAKVGDEAIVSVDVSYVNDESGQNIEMTENGGQDSDKFVIGHELPTEASTEEVENTDEDMTTTETAKEEETTPVDTQGSSSVEEESSSVQGSTENTQGPETGDNNVILIPIVIMILCAVAGYGAMKLHKSKEEEV